MDEIKTLTVDDVVARLIKLPHDTKIFMSRDSEGNGYGTLNETSFSVEPLDNAIILFPNVEYLEYDEICPNESEAEDQD